MVAVNNGVVKLSPVAILTPPVGVVNQLIVPSENVAPKTTEPSPHISAGVVEVRVGLVLNSKVTSKAGLAQLLAAS